LAITREAALQGKQHLSGTVWQVRKGRGIKKVKNYFSFTKIDSRRCPCITFSFLYSFATALTACRPARASAVSVVPAWQQVEVKLILSILILTESLPFFPATYFK
jgi:hypothetical protein